MKGIRLALLLLGMLTCACGPQDRYYPHPVQPFGDYPNDCRYQLKADQSFPSGRLAVVSEITVQVLNRDASGTKTRPGDIVWRIAAIGPTQAHGFVVTLLSPPEGFKETAYRPELVTMNNEYVLTFRVKSGPPPGNASVVEKEYSRYVYNATMATAKRSRDKQ